MEIIKLQEKINGLRNYISGLKKIIAAAERTITAIEVQIMRTCKHEFGMQYVVGINYEAEKFHCKYCSECNVLFITESFGYFDKPRQDEYKTMGIGGLATSYFIDYKTMRSGK